jgi:hypothetical protein
MAGRAKRTAKRETYYDRWRRQHIRVSFYFKREEYEKLKELASSKNMTVKEFVVSLMEGFDKYREDVELKAREEEMNYYIDSFLYNPREFYEEVRPEAEDEGIEPVLFTLPCSVCGKPMLFTHKDENWSSEVRPILLEAFKGWGHVCCFEVRDGRRASCTHLPYGLRLSL